MKSLLFLLFVLPIVASDKSNFNKDSWVAAFQHSVALNNISAANQLVDELYAASNKIPAFQRDSFCDEIGKECAIHLESAFFPTSAEMLILMSRFCLRQSDPYSMLILCRDYLKTEIERGGPITNSELEQKWNRAESLINIHREVSFPFKERLDNASHWKAYKKLKKLFANIQQRQIAVDEYLSLARAVSDNSLLLNRRVFLDRCARSVQSLKKSLQSA